MRYALTVGILEQIKASTERRRDLVKQIKEVDTERQKQVRQAFEEGHSGNVIGEALNSDRNRAYQIRDGRR